MGIDDRGGTLVSAPVTTSTVRLRRLVALAVVVLTFALVAQARADTITDLGDFVPMGLNDHDQVVGDVLDTNSYDHAALWSGSLQMLGQLGSADESDAYAISDGGRIAGDDYASTSSVHGVYWNGGGTANQVSPFFAPSQDYTELNDVDTAGELAGFAPASSTSPYETGFIDKAGSATPVGAGDSSIGPNSAVGAITPNGQLLLGYVNGGTEPGPFYYLWSAANPNAAGTPLNLTPPKNGALGFDGAEFGTLIANDLASDGTVLGYTGTGSAKTFYIRLPGGTETRVSGLHLANAVNASHVVAGAIYGPSLADPLHAAIWTNGALRDLNTLLPPGTTGWHLVEAFAINNSGDIVGVGIHNNHQVGFLLNTSASMSVKFGAIGQLQVGKVVDVPVTVTAGSVDLSSVSLGDGLSVSGNHAKVESQAADISGFSLSAGASRTFIFKVKGLSEGNAGLSLSAAARSARGNVTDSATATVKVWNPKLDVLRLKVPSDPGGTINLEYRGLGWDPGGGEISLRFSGEDAGHKEQAATFEDTLKLHRWPKRTTDERAIKDRAGGGYCWGELSASQGGLFDSKKVEGKWQGWVLWSANPEIKAHEAWCEGEEYSFFARSREPIVVMGDFPEGRKFGLAVKVFGADGAGTASPTVIIHHGPVLNYHDGPRDACIAVSLDHNGDLITTHTHGRCV